MIAKDFLRRLGRWAAGMPHPAAQYYSAYLTPAEERTLLRRNYLLLQAGQAALGLIGPDILAIAVEPRHDEVILHIAIASHTKAVQEDVADITGDLDAFLAGGPEQRTRISAEIHTGPADEGWPGRGHALLYLAKPKAEPPIHNS